jgi:Fe-S-cluster-containing dehydrogenase component
MSENTTTVRHWAMVIDLDKCTGCQACVVACHAENNVPTVGPEEVVKGRSQHWLRIERYWDGEYPEIRARFIPMLCQQCHKAPCETVCPVFATYHSDVQNLNIQAYNRCVGTRYCANNCPYLARMFNFWNPYFPDPLPEQLNPDVTVRSRGVMEKCTFCIQRIHGAEERAASQGRALQDGDVQPACAGTCPTGAIIFGDAFDPNSQVGQLVRSRRAFKVLEEMGTEPAVIYLKGGTSNAE